MVSGERLGPYTIVGLLGEGGMGQVYRATDTNLKRQVAIKVLPSSLAGDTDRLSRFQREAEVLAALNHPNIAAIYGLEKSDGITALVMELVEGDDLSQRIAHGAIPLDEALPIATQIAEALEAAHEQGIIHRDLKPANIKVRADGTVKVLDFGLAKALEGPGGAGGAGKPGGHDLSASPTLTSPAMTQAGVILGTAAYMSPEQAKGRPVDRRADIWAFGAVLFEMLTGRRAFPGEDVTDTIVSVISKEPDFAALPATVPARVTQVLRLCLRKDPKQRAGDIRDVRLALDGAFETAAIGTTAMATSAPALRARVAWMVAAAAVVGAAALAIPGVRHLREAPPPAPPETRTEIITPTTNDPASFALSPDGRQIVFVASGDGVSRLWVRSLATTTAQPLAGTEGATSPFWSPDGRSVGFFAESVLKRLDLGGGAPQTLAPATTGLGGTWSADGAIVFSPTPTSPLLRVAATGGPVTAVTTLGAQQVGHSLPFFLPGGRRILFTALGGPDGQGIYLTTLDGSTPARLTSDGSQAAYLAAAPGDGADGGGWLLWARTNTLVAQRLDLEQQTLVGDPVTLADGMSTTRGATAIGGYSVAPPGLIAYRAGSGRQRQVTWVDPSGTARGTVGEPDGTLWNPRASPDGRRVMVQRTAQANVDLWLLDGARTSRLTFDPAVDGFPVWSPDATRIAFYSRRTGVGDLYQTRTNGGGGEERLVAGAQIMVPISWSRDGRFLLYNRIGAQTNADIWVLPMVGDHTPSVFLQTPFREAYGVFSPDGRWVAYQSNESGRTEVYVRPFVAPGAADQTAVGQWQVSTTGGLRPMWRPDGKALYYLNPAGAMMAATIAVSGATLEPGPPAVLFPTRIVDGGVDTQNGRQYDVAPDGRFLINMELDEAAEPITLIQHWNPEAKP